MGIARIYTPKDFELNRIMIDIVALADPGSGNIAAQ
jgi:(2R)-ethylmalonyl-CoA mutase